MPIEVAVGSFTKQTGTGNQDIDLSSHTNLPDLDLLDDGTWAVVFLMSGSDASAGTWDQHLNVSLGFAANGGGSISEYVVQGNSDDNRDTAMFGSNTTRRAAAGVISINYEQTVRAEAVMGATPFPTATDMRVNWTTNTASAPWGTPTVTYFLITGLTNAKVVKSGLGGSTGTTNITGAGFTPELVFLSTVLLNGLGSGTHSCFAFGMANKHGQQVANSIWMSDNVNPTTTSRFQQTDAAFAVVRSDSVTEQNNFEAHFKAMTSDGYTLHSSTNNVGAGWDLISLCMEGISSKIGAFVKATAAAPTTQIVDSRHGFTPKGLMFSSVHDTPRSTPNIHAIWNMGFSDLANQRVSDVSDLDAQTTTSVDSVWANDAAYLTGAGSSESKGSLSDIDEDTLSLLLNPNSANGWEIAYAIFGDDGNNTFPATSLDSATTNAAATATSNQKKVAVLDSGRMVRVVGETTTNARFEWSDDGQTWTDYGADIAGWENGSLIVATINSVEYLFVVWKQNGTGGGRTDDSSYVAVGTFASSQTSLSWGGITNGGLIADTRLDVSDLVVSQNGTGGTLHVFQSYSQTAGGTINNTYHAWWTISSTAVLAAITNVELGTPGGYGVAAHTFPSAVIDGNRIHVTWSVGATGAGKGVRYRTGTVSGSTVTWATEVEIDNTLYHNGTYNTLRCRWDGTRIIVGGLWFTGSVLKWRAYESSSFTSFGAAIIDTTEIADNGSFEVEAVSGDIYIAGQNGAYNNFGYWKWDRSTSTLGSQVVTDAGVQSGERHVHAFLNAGNLAWIYTRGNNSPYAIAYDQLVLNSPPSVVLDSPTDGSLIPQAGDITLEYTVTDPLPSGDGVTMIAVRRRRIV